MHILVTHRSPCFLRGNGRVAIQPERLGRLLVSVEDEAAIAGPRFRPAAMLLLAMAVIE
jgi:hypothetical protein